MRNFYFLNKSSNARRASPGRAALLEYSFSAPFVGAGAIGAVSFSTVMRISKNVQVILRTLLHDRFRNWLRALELRSGVKIHALFAAMQFVAASPLAVIATCAIRKRSGATFGSATSPRRRRGRSMALAPRERLANESGGFAQCITALGQDRRENLPAMRHAMPDAQCRVDTGARRVLGDAAEIVEQHFTVAHLDQHRRQTGQVRVDRRCERIGRGRGTEIVPRLARDPRAIEQRIDRRHCR